MSKSPQAKSQTAENGRPSHHHRRPYSKAGLEKRNLTLNYLKKKMPVHPTPGQRLLSSASDMQRKGTTR